MNPQIANVFIYFLWFLIIAMIARALLSWFPQAQNNQFARIVHQITEPLVEPVRRYMPRTGMIDFSSMIVIIVLYIMINVVNAASD